MMKGLKKWHIAGALLLVVAYRALDPQHGLMAVELLDVLDVLMAPLAVLL